MGLGPRCYGLTGRGAAMLADGASPGITRCANRTPQELQKCTRRFTLHVAVLRDALSGSALLCSASSGAADCRVACRTASLGHRAQAHHRRRLGRPAKTTLLTDDRRWVRDDGPFGRSDVHRRAGQHVQALFWTSIYTAVTSSGLAMLEENEPPQQQEAIAVCSALHVRRPSITNRRQRGGSTS